MAVSTISQAGLDAPITLTGPTLTTPTINSAQVATVSGTAPIYMCRAWVNFNGTGTVAIRTSGNVSSITDNGTGDYTVNITNAMSDANYAVCAIGYSDNAGLTLDIYLSEATVPTASLFRVRSLQTSTTAANDAARIHLSIFR